MPRRERTQRWGMPADRREPLMARLALLVLIANAFVWAGLRGTDILVVTLVSVLLGLGGLVMAYVSLRKIRRMGGRIGGEAVATIAYWGNLIVFVLAGLMFAYAVAMGILRGDLL